MTAVLFTVAAAAAALAAWALWFEPRRVVVRRHDLWLDRWPAARDGLRLVLVADLHTGAPHVDLARVERIARLAAAQNPDLLALLGDFVDDEVVGGEQVAPEPVAARLGTVRARLGTVAVLGNHDWHAGGGRIARALRDAGVIVLENDAVRIAGDPGELWVAGLADATKRVPDIAGTLGQVPEDAAVLVLSHDPDLFPRIPDRVALTVSGHTHGGQIALPGVRGRWIPSRFGARYAGGHIVEGGRQLVVSRGIGTSRFPVRIGAPPEIVVLRLFAASSHDQGRGLVALPRCVSPC